MTEHIRTKHKIRMLTRTELEKLLKAALLSENERRIIIMHYIEHKSLGYIADMLGYSYSAAKENHKNALKTISYLL